MEKAAAGLTAGGLGAMVGSPADLTLIRMQSDSTLPVASRRNYKGVGDAMVRRVVRRDVSWDTTRMQGLAALSRLRGHLQHSSTLRLSALAQFALTSCKHHSGSLFSCSDTSVKSGPILQVLVIGCASGSVAG